ncbi:MAG: pantetheine-phosphate adenylyltransferase [Firmicutes bacterium]|nr:pantetheine-phosphate adenylyltransferase [Bacillota bacterium]
MKIAVYAGTFDPVTLGHLDILERSSKMFDKVILAIAEENYKDNLFEPAERLEIAKQATEHIPNVEVMLFNGLTVEFCRSVGAQIIIRGLRALSDFEKEFQIALMNKKVAPEIDSVFLMTAPEYQFVSSSIVKNFSTLGCVPEGIISPCVADALLEKFHCRNTAEQD